MVRRIFDLLDRYQALYPDKADALAGKQNGTWIRYSAHDYIEKSNNISYGLLSLGLKPGDKIAVVSNNRPEWNFIDMGMAQIGAVHVPIYPTISFDDYTYIFHHSEPKILFVSDRNLYEKLKGIAAKIPSIVHIFSFNQVDGVQNWREIIELGKENQEKFYNELERTKCLVQPEDLAAIIYTSGTTGVPKGVMLSHHNIISNFLATSKRLPLEASHRLLSFLPLSHVYERIINYNCQYKGIGIYYAENLGTIMDNMKEVRPHMFVTVPRLLERIYAGIIGKGKDLSMMKKMIFFWAVDLGLKYEINHQNGWWYNLQLKMANRLIFSKWRDALGGEVKLIVCGGAALQPRLNRLFSAAGLEILEGYGLTETSPVIAVNDPVKRELKIGTVGTVLDGVNVRIAEDGEILCKGDNVMMGYYKAPEMTAEVIDEEGWFHTGDIGVFEEGKFLKITDRKKEIFKLSSGKYIAPQSIENKLKESFFIEQVMVVGENEKFASALIVPNFNYLHNWCSRHSINFRDNAELINQQPVMERYQKEINQINKTLGQTEHIKRFRLVTEEWSPVTGELSPTLKLRRKYIFDKYKNMIEEIYFAKKDEEI